MKKRKEIKQRTISSQNARVCQKKAKNMSKDNENDQRK